MANKKISELPYLGNTGYTSQDIMPIVTYFSSVTGDTVYTPLTDFKGVINITYLEFYTLASTNSLIQGSYYSITDFETIYDRPDYFPNGEPRKDINTITTGVNPIIVFATSNSTISTDSYQISYPYDKIKYDFKWVSTEINGTPTTGRISERIDEYNNRTDYDHRTVEFKRYQSYNLDSQLTGTITDYDCTTGVVVGVDTLFLGEVSPGDVLLFNSKSILGYNIGVKVVNVNTDTSIDVIIDSSYGGTVFAGESINFYYSVSSSDYLDYKEVYVGQSDNSDYSVVPTLILDGFTLDNYIGDYSSYYINGSTPVVLSFLLSNNVLGDTSISNTFGDISFNNTLPSKTQNNKISDLFYNNIIRGELFAGNKIGSYFYENIISYGLYNNNVGNGFSNNTLYNEVSQNTIGNNFSDNEMNSSIVSNVIGENFSFNQTIMKVDFSYNHIGNYFVGNQIGNTFSSNQIGNFFGDTNKNLSSNLVAVEFLNNQVGDYFGSDGQGTPLGNQIGVVYRISYSGLAGGTFSVGDTISNGVGGSAEVVSDDGVEIMTVNVLIGDISIGDIIDNGGGVTGEVTNFEVSIKNDGVMEGNVIGNHFVNNQIGKNFNNNKIGNYFGNDMTTDISNIILDNFESNIIGNYFGIDVESPSTGEGGNIIRNNFIGNTIGDSFTYNITYDTSGGGYNNNQIGWGCNTNTFGDGFNYNKIGDLFQENLLGVYFAGNEIGYFFNLNQINDNAGFNRIGEISWFNQIDTGFEANRTGVSFFGNTIGADFTHNTIGNYFGQFFVAGNIWGDNVYDNKFGDHTYGNEVGSNFNNNNIFNNFIGNIVGDGFQYNVIQYDVSEDFTSATHVYNNYTCTLLNDSTSTLKLIYLDGSPALVAVSPVS